MQIKSADYTASYIDYEKCPKQEIPEFAFIGRSNVGKSSLINYLCGRKKLSKVSNTPGKTQTLNYFLINGRLNFVDLPGYSFAKVSIEQRNKWNNMIRNYILHREQLLYVFQLIDARIPPQKVDLDFINWMGKNHVPLVVIFTKADKQGSKEVTSNIQAFKNALLKEWDELPIMFTTSSEKKTGGEKVLEFVEAATESYYQAKQSNVANQE